MFGFQAGPWHRIVEYLANGGMSRVYLAEHVKLGARVAVKVLPADSARELVQRFAVEARLLCRQNHPHIVHGLDAGALPDGSHYLLMELAPGLDLERVLEREQRLAPGRVLRILRQLALALDHLHLQGILHRDLKPANIVIAPHAGDALKLLDLGIAVHEGSAEAQLPQAVFGTPAYMAPEQAARQCCTRATDLYALGALALELLTGRPPYEHVAPHALLQALLRDSPGLPSTRGVNVCGLDAFFERALAREPHLRFTTGRELVDALESVLRPRARKATQLTAASHASWLGSLRSVLRLSGRALPRGRAELS